MTSNISGVFSAYDSVNGQELWVTDSTTTGTRLLKDIYQGSRNANPANFTPLGNGKVLFTATDAANGTELWISDGTAAGTSLVKDINAGAVHSNPQNFFSLGNGKVLFTANDGVTDRLWITDGTAAGTISLLSNVGTTPNLISLGNGKVLFNRVGEGNLWITDGTVAGTSLITSVHSYIYSPSNFTSLGNGKVLFTSDNNLASYGQAGNEPWVTDGTAAGTHLLKDISYAYGSVFSGSDANNFFSLGNGKMLFSANDGINGRELWITDGTTAGTSLVKDINVGGNSSNPSSFTLLGNGKAVFSATYAGDTELFVTDGTEAGTYLVKDINPGIDYDSNPSNFFSLGNGKVLFSATDGVHGEELWITDGTAAGTSMVKNIAAPGISYPQNFFSLGNGKVLFSANTEINGRELWVTDGTTEGTSLVKDIVVGWSSSNPYDFISLGNGKALFNIGDYNSKELWITDGTTAGTQKVSSSAYSSAVTIFKGLTVANTMTGTAGNDNYTVDHQGDIIIEQANQGYDIVYSSVSYTLPTNVEQIELTGTANINATGNADNNRLLGNSGANVLIGGAGADTMTGGAGNDSYNVDNVGDVINETGNSTADIVYSTVSYSLSANIYALMLIGSANINATGNLGNNLLIGNTGNNTLITGGGADTLRGATGNDTYIIDHNLNVIQENAGEGTDTVITYFSGYTLTTNIENLVLGGSYAAGTGNTLNNTITGNTANNTLNGGLGADTLIGGLGNDVYYVDQAGDTITEQVNQGYDIVYSSATNYSLSADVEQIELLGTANLNATGNAGNNRLIGNSAANVLIGGAGADTMTGGAGNDSYNVDNVNDVINETGNSTADIVYSTVSYSLSANIYALMLIGSANINATGNLGNNLLIGNTGNNTLITGGGIDTLRGGTGDDTYIIDHNLNVIQENAGEGLDTVLAFFNGYTLGANLENLTLGGTYVSGNGNALDNTITGNAANNTLTGGEGADTLIGKVGADTYLLAETTAKTDTVRIAQGDSNVSGFDIVKNFKLGTGSGTTGVDQLDLDSTTIAGNTAGVNGTDAGTIKSHSITNGIIRFDDIDTFGSGNTPVTVSSATNLSQVLSYLQQNIADNETVAFTADSNTYVFQGGATNDTLVQLVGVSATGLDVTGISANSVWIV